MSIDGSERWRIRATKEFTVPWLAWDDERRVWLALEFGAGERRQNAIVRIAETGQVTDRFDIGAEMDYVFASQGRRRVAREGSIIDTRTGQVIGALGTVRNDVARG